VGVRNDTNFCGGNNTSSDNSNRGDSYTNFFEAGGGDWECMDCRGDKHDGRIVVVEVVVLLLSMFSSANVVVVAADNNDMAETTQITT
jgi:hypothetical protein